MNQSPLSWFDADHVFATQRGWYIGAANGFRVGPYSGEEKARRQSDALVVRLNRCQSTADRVRVVRTFLHEQNDKHGCQLLTGPATPSPAADGTVDEPPVRHGELRKVWFRTSRFFSVDEVWFFSTREAIDVGPYESREEAEHDANRLVQILQETASDVESRLAIQQFKSRPRLSIRGR